MVWEEGAFASGRPFSWPNRGAIHAAAWLQHGQNRAARPRLVQDIEIYNEFMEWLGRSASAGRLLQQKCCTLLHRAGVV
jgi:hypothetical protein